MRVRILYFAVVRERLRRDAEELELAAGTTAAAAWRELERLHPELGALRSVVRLAINEEFAPQDRVLAEGDVIALIPPVAGGARVVTFTGVVRRQSRGRTIVPLEYEAYRPLAQARGDWRAGSPNGRAVQQRRGRFP